ncbi:MAG: asparagine synthase (glutamine-hydrolyzing), partial [Bacteroidota bacterium]
MCGLLGAVHLHRPFTVEQQTQLEASLQMISYRGPDASSHKWFNTLTEATEQVNVFMGHNRLSIIDLSESGTQPFTNDDAVFIIFNGEIYNYLELRADLRKLGYDFQTDTDTEVIVNLYKAEGIEGFRKMNGMWAFMLYDQRKQQLILSRDRFSIKPLYYYTSEDGLLVFASEIKQLLPFVKDLKPNINVLGNYLHNYIVDYSNETFFEGIQKLPPKSAMTIDLKQKTKQIASYWDFKAADYSKRTAQDLKEEFKHLFEDAVRVRLRSDVKVGNTLSGGLDSSSIAVTADKINNTKLNNLSVVTKNKAYSEEQYVDLLIKEKGLLVQKLQNEASNPWQQVQQVIWHNDEPILSLSTVAHFNM